ncbi:MAG TPA: hypothetical protein PKD00_00295 [Burkholderiales bacterium]|nr:hypothetical protein [Burkholderiales bacterium]
MSIIIKNNIEVQDIRLGRIEEFDQRSLNFPITTVLKTGVKRNRIWRCTENYDQGNIGACVAFSIAHELAATPVEVLGLKNNYIIEQIYWEAQKIDPWAGGAYPSASPKYEGTSVLAGVKIAQKLGYFEQYRWAFGLNDVLLGLSSSGPCVLGIKWYSNMSIPDSKNFITPTGQLQGGHAILARGVDWNNKHVILHNSWGKNWGDKGNCYIKFEDLELLLKDNGEAVFFSQRKNPYILKPKK